MLTRYLMVICCVLFSIALSGASWAAEQPYKYEQTKKLAALVEEAAKLVEARGEEAFAQLRQKGSKWHQGELSVFVDDIKGVNLVNPAFLEMEGESLMDFRDVMGKPVMQNFIDALYGPQGKRSAWIHYLYPKPGAAKPSWKTSYIVRAQAPSGKKYIVGAGLYKMKMEPSFLVNRVDQAVRLIEKYGTDAFTELRSPDSQFVFANTYVFVENEKGVELVNPAFPDLEGRNLIDLTDSNGLFIVKKLIALVKDKGRGWLEYQWPRPGEIKSSAKRTFVKGARYKGELYIVGCGYYP